MSARVVDLIAGADNINRRAMNDNIDSKIIKSYDLVKKVGKGAYGQVWKCINKKTKAQCALKRIFDAFRNATDCQRTYRQIMYLKHLRHPCIVAMHTYHQSLNGRDMYIEMEYVESDLATALKNDYLRDMQREYIFAQVVSGVYYLHSGSLLHRDLKPANILLGPSCEAKICDFGLVRSICPTELRLTIAGVSSARGNSVNTKLTDNIATRWYKAPELLLSACDYGKQIDIWSLGCILAEMYIGRPLFQGTSTFNQLERIIDITGIPQMGEISQFIKSETSIAVLRSFIDDASTNLLLGKKSSDTSLNATVGTPTSKSTCSLNELDALCSIANTYNKLVDIMPHNHLLIDLLARMLQFDPRRRLTIEQVMQHPYLDRFRCRVQWGRMEASPVVRYDSLRLPVEEYRLLLAEGGDQVELDLSRYEGGKDGEAKQRSRSKQSPGRDTETKSQKSFKFHPSSKSPVPSPLPSPKSTHKPSLKSSAMVPCNKGAYQLTTSKVPHNYTSPQYHTTYIHTTMHAPIHMYKSSSNVQAVESVRQREVSEKSVSVRKSENKSVVSNRSYWGRAGRDGKEAKKDEEKADRKKEKEKEEKKEEQKIDKPSETADKSGPIRHVPSFITGNLRASIDKKLGLPPHLCKNKSSKEKPKHRPKQTLNQKVTHHSQQISLFHLHPSQQSQPTLPAPTQPTAPIANNKTSQQLYSRPLYLKTSNPETKPNLYTNTNCGGHKLVYCEKVPHTYTEPPQGGIGAHVEYGMHEQALYRGQYVRGEHGGNRQCVGGQAGTRG